jgi:hypothetical protein
MGHLRQEREYEKTWFQVNPTNSVLYYFTKCIIRDVETQRAQYTQIDITRPLNTCGVFTSDFALVAYLSIILSIFHLLPLAVTCQKSFFLLFSPIGLSRLDTHNPNHAFTVLYAMAVPEMYVIRPG